MATGLKRETIKTRFTYKKTTMLIMKRIFSTLAIAITAATAAMAQSAQEGISYFLPKTGVQIALRIEKKTFTPGKLAPYSDIYFKKPAETQPSVSYRSVRCNRCIRRGFLRS